MGLVGKKVGPYKVLAQIGQGGMAVVYKAEQPSLERLVAVKELRKELAADPNIVTRFEREARSLAALTHHNIVHIYDFLERQNGLYIIMEHVDGIDAATLLKRAERLPPDITAIIGLQTARALEYAHFHGVIHRDLKPSNLMLTKEGTVKLMDFGIARDETLDDLTLPGQALGTPSYMSPEQIMGETIDMRSDIFSFGIVLYQLLTGHKPFVEDETIGVMHRILNKSYRAPRKLYPDIPWRMQRIVKRCMQKDPDDRYQHAEKLRSDLERLVAKTVKINQSGRLVIYMRHRELITDNEAKTFVRPEALDSLDTVAEDSGQLSPWAVVFKPILAFNLGAVLFFAIAMAVLEFVSPTFARGYLHVNALPWAEVYVDGEHHDTTPFAEPIPLPPGKHRIELRNRHFRTVVREVEVVAQETQRLQVDLEKKR